MKGRLPVTPFFKNSGEPTRHFREILNVCQVQEDTFEGIVEVTQECWRQHGTTAAKVEDKDEHLREILLPHLRGLGLIGEMPLAKERGQWGIVLGGTYAAIHKRLALAVRAWNKGGHWVNTAVLTNERVLFKDKQETIDVLTNPVKGALPFAKDWKVPSVLPETESQLFAYIATQVGHKFPWNRLPEHEHDVVTVGTEGGTRKTIETLASRCDPRGETCFVFSSQPYVQRQTLETQLALGARFAEYHGTGYDDRDANAINVTQTLDDIAKLIFAINEART